MSGRDRVAWLKGRNYIDAMHVACAERLIHDNEMALQSASYARVSSGTRGGRDYLLPGENLRAASDRIEAVRDVLGPKLSEILTLVVVGNKTLTDAAAIMDIHEKSALPLVQAAFEVLAGHYSRYLFGKEIHRASR